MIVEIVWRAWDSAEQHALLDHDPPGGTSIGLHAFATAMLLLLAVAVYVGRTDGATFGERIGGTPLSVMLLSTSPRSRSWV